jgi:hypothetical protein
MSKLKVQINTKVQNQGFRHLSLGFELTFDLDLLEISRLSDITGAKHEDTGDRRMWVHWE